MDTPETASWLTSITGETTARRIAAKLNRSHTTVSRWMRGGIPLVSLVHLCVERRLDLPAALVGVGVITDADSRRLPRNLTVVQTWELTAELHRRAVQSRRTA